MSAARSASRRGAPSAPQPPGVKAPGWIHNKRVDCPVYLGLWICVICIRTGRDLRRLLCPFGGA